VPASHTHGNRQGEFRALTALLTLFDSFAHPICSSPLRCHTACDASSV
jgi:hypothetical protein